MVSFLFYMGDMMVQFNLRIQMIWLNFTVFSGGLQRPYGFIKHIVPNTHRHMIIFCPPVGATVEI